MVGDSLELFSGIAKDIFEIAGNASTILGLVLTLLPDPKSKIKQKWDNFLVEYVKDRDGNINSVDKDIEFIFTREVETEKYCEQRGLWLVFATKYNVTEKTILQFVRKDGKTEKVEIRYEEWAEY